MVVTCHTHSPEGGAAVYEGGESRPASSLITKDLGLGTTRDGRHNVPTIYITRFMQTFDSTGKCT